MPTHKQIIRNFSVEPMEGEIFKPIPWIKGYSVSNYGRIRREESKRINPKGARRFKRKIVKHKGINSFNAHYKKHSLSACVYRVFRGDYDQNKYLIMHINKVPVDNRIENLKIVTRTELLQDNQNKLNTANRPKKNDWRITVRNGKITHIVCSKCEKKKKISEYPVCIFRKDGSIKTYACKKCTNEIARRNYNRRKHKQSFKKEV